VKVHFVTIGDRSVASTRVRALALADALRALGHVVTTGRPRSKETARLFLGGGKCDAVVLQKVLPGERTLLALRRRCDALIIDLDDAIYFGYPGEAEDRARARYKRLEAAARVADALTTPSPVVASDLADLFHRRLVHPGPAPSVDLDAPELLALKKEPKLIWLGSPSTGGELRALDSAGAALGEFPTTPIAMGATAGQVPTPMEAARWDLASQRRLLSEATVGLVPLTRGRWNDRKACYKAIEYAAWGVATIGSESPALEATGPVGQLATKIQQDEDWSAAIEARAREAVDGLEVARLTAAARQIDANAYASAWLGLFVSA
jgi:hypothetical protein